MKKPARQRGMMLIEALMAVLIFSLGILGMVGLNALAVSSQSDGRLACAGKPPSSFCWVASHFSASLKCSLSVTPMACMARMAQAVVWTAWNWRSEVAGEKLPMVAEPSVVSW